MLLSFLWLTLFVNNNRYYTYFVTVFMLIVFSMFDAINEWENPSFRFGAEWISLTIAVLGIVVCVAIYWKTNKIYWQIMLTSEFFEIGTENDENVQIQLFWLSDPNKMKHANQLVGWLFSLYVGERDERTEN